MNDFMKGFGKAAILAAAGGAIGGVAAWGHGIDPTTVQCVGLACQPYLHQIGVAAGSGALAAVMGLFIRRPQDAK